MPEGISSRTVDMRYAGQGYELPVPWSKDFVGQFHRLHEQRYGYADSKRDVEVVNVRVRMLVASGELPLNAKAQSATGDAKVAVIGEKPIFCDGQWRAGKIYDRARLLAGDIFSGPAVVVEYSATTYMPPGAQATVDHFGNIEITL